VRSPSTTRLASWASDGPSGCNLHGAGVNAALRVRDDARDRRHEVASVAHAHDRLVAESDRVDARVDAVGVLLANLGLEVRSGLDYLLGAELAGCVCILGTDGCDHLRAGSAALLDRGPADAAHGAP
jgi:hypothetical protein